MNKPEISSDTFSQYIKQAIDRLRRHELAEAYKLIIEAIHLDPDAPQPHNLLGIWFELNNNEDKARKHYRAAYALDPTFKPACKNLERICTMFQYRPIPYAYGDELEEENTEGRNRCHAESKSK
ncbi:MAG: hypothetical protein AAGU27_15895 [Dehalobacterium sp.]